MKCLRSILAILLVIVCGASTRAGGPISFVVELRQSFDPPGLGQSVTNKTSYLPPGFALSDTVVAPETIGVINGPPFHFTHWTLDGVRVQDAYSRALNPVSVRFTNNVEAVAHYVSSTNSISGLIPDWFVIGEFGNVDTSPGNDGDSDGVPLSSEYLRGSSPHFADVYADGGVSRRRSDPVLLIVEPAYITVTFDSDPAGLEPDGRDRSFPVPWRRGVPLPLRPAQTMARDGYEFIGWYVGPTRMDSPSMVGGAVIPDGDIRLTARYVPRALDADHDGLSDGWELFHFGTLEYSPGSDPDGDGFSIAMEYQRGTSDLASDLNEAGGLSRRRSTPLVVVASREFVKVTHSSIPLGLEPEGMTVSEPVVMSRGAYAPLPGSISMERSGFTFVGWYVGEVRVDDPLKLGIQTTLVRLFEDTMLMARYVPAVQDEDSDGLPDGFELFNFGTLQFGPANDNDGDGFTIEEERRRGTNDLVSDDVQPGGISRRRSTPFQFVPARPEILGGPASVRIIASDAPIDLEVVTRAIGPVGFQWMLNGVAMPGETNRTLVLPSANPTNSGSYGVAVSNPFGVTSSEDVPVIAESPSLGLEDFILLAASHPNLAGDGVGSGSNANATLEKGEPSHAGKRGEHSVWFAWTAPSAGVATFGTRGSTFDTVLAAYSQRNPATALSVGNLRLLASDDDRGGYLTSLIRFNVQAGRTYYIAVDGFAGATGFITLSWHLDPKAPPIPSFTIQPLNKVTGVGGSVAFETAADGVGKLRYQWRLNGSNLQGADAARLLIPNVGESDVGYYTVVVTDDNESVESDRAFLQINVPDPLTPGADVQQVASFDKLGDVLSPDLPGGSLGARNAVLGSRTGRGVAGLEGIGAPSVVGLGGGQIFSTFGNGRQIGETNCCGEFGGASSWYPVRVSEDGPVLVSTEGSGFDSVAAVYTGRPNATDFSLLSFPSLNCDSTNGFDHISSRFTFMAEKGRNYYIQVDGAKPVSKTIEVAGLVRLFWTVRHRPLIRGLPPGSIAKAGSEVVLSVDAPGPAPKGVQWYFGTNLLSGATNLSLVLPRVGPADTGGYAVEVLDADGIGRARDYRYLKVDGEGAQSGSVGFFVQPPDNEGSLQLIVKCTQRIATVSYADEFGDGGRMAWTPLGIFTNIGVGDKMWIRVPVDKAGRTRFYRCEAK